MKYFKMVNKCRYQLSSDDYKLSTSPFVKLVHLENEKDHIRLYGIKIHLENEVQFQESSRFGEIAIDGKVLRIDLVTNSLNLKIDPDFSPKFPKRSRMYNNDSSNRSILKLSKENGCNTSSKSVSFNNTYYITPISPRQNEKSLTPVKDYESMYKEYLKSVQMNGACSTPEKEKASESPSNNTEEENMEPLGMDEGEDIEYLDPPKKKRGRPKGSGNLKRAPPPPPKYRDPNSPKKRGWPLGLSRKTMTMKPVTTVTTPVYQPPTTPVRKRGRPKKIVSFGFQSIVSDIKTVTLPSDLWSAHVSVTAKKSQVCFTRVVQAVSNAVPVECDRSVKFNGTVNYLVRINNRDVELLAAPPVVSSLQDVEILLQIVNEIGINDPVLEYLNR